MNYFLELGTADDSHHAWAARAAAKPLNKGQHTAHYTAVMPRAASTCCAAVVLGAVQARGPNCFPAAQARPDATWPRDDGSSRQPYAARSHCRVPSDVAPRREAWLDAL